MANSLAACQLPLFRLRSNPSEQEKVDVTLLALVPLAASLQLFRFLVLPTEVLPGCVPHQVFLLKFCKKIRRR